MDIKVLSIRGMNHNSSGILINQGVGIAIPKILLNCYTPNYQKLKVRGGCTRISTPSRPTCIWSSRKYIYMIAMGTSPEVPTLFWSEDGITWTSAGVFPGVDHSFDYSGPIVYASSDILCRTFDEDTMTIGPWVRGSGNTASGMFRTLMENCTDPSPMNNICFWAGRVFGSREGKVLYSMPGQPCYWHPQGILDDFGEEVTLIACTQPTPSSYADGGLYVGTRRDTWFYSGGDIDKMPPRRVGNGAIKGSRSYLTPHRNPIWVSEDDIIQGSPAGDPVSLLRIKAKAAFGDRASVSWRYTDENNLQLIVASTLTLDTPDAETKQAIKTGGML